MWSITRRRSSMVRRESCSNDSRAAATASSPVTVVADPATCTFQFDPIGKATFTSGCDVAKSALANAGISYSNAAAPAGTPAAVRIGAKTVPSLEGAQLPKAEFKTAKDAWTKGFAAELKAAGYPPKADPAKMDKVRVVFFLWLLVIFVTLVYGPIAAALVEMFPARIRYTSMSLPYHLGNGWLGGFLTPTAFAMVAATGNIYFGLWYPIAVAAFTGVVGLLFVKEMKGAAIED